MKDDARVLDASKAVDAHVGPVLNSIGFLNAQIGSSGGTAQMTYSAVLRGVVE